MENKANQKNKSRAKKRGYLFCRISSPMPKQSGYKNIIYQLGKIQQD